MCGHSFHPRHAKSACPGGPGFRRNGRVGFSSLVYAISKNALAGNGQQLFNTRGIFRLGTLLAAVNLP
jgi:hypothetical protein